MPVNSIINRTAVAGALALVLAGCGLTPSGPAAEGGGEGSAVTVGLLTNLTSDLAATGIYVKDGFTLAVEEINRAGGIAGREIRVVEGDTADSNSVATNALRRVLDSEPLALMGPIFGTQVLAMSPAIKQAEVPMMYSAGTVEVSEQGNDLLFGLHPSDAVAAEAMTKFAVDELGLNSVALEIVNNEYGHGAGSIIKKTLEEQGAELTAEASHGLADKDLSGQLSTLLGSKPEGVIFWGHPGDTATGMQQIHARGYAGTKLGATATLLPSTLSLVSPEESAGWYGETVALPTASEDPEAQEWVKRFEQRFGRAPTAFDTIAYDGGIMMAKAMEAALEKLPDGSVEELRAAVRDELAGVSHEGIGTNYDFDEKGRGAHSFLIAQIQPDQSMTVVGQAP
jgi:branched-chain amino acid transport system substrate-binding protein